MSMPPNGLAARAKGRGMGKGVAPPRATSVGLRPPDNRLRLSSSSKCSFPPCLLLGHKQFLRIGEIRLGHFSPGCNHDIVSLPSEARGLRYDKRPRNPGAQTERQGGGIVRLMVTAGRHQQLGTQKPKRLSII